MKNVKEFKRNLYEINNLEPIDLYLTHKMGKYKSKIIRRVVKSGHPSFLFYYHVLQHVFIDHLSLKLHSSYLSVKYKVVCFLFTLQKCKINVSEIEGTSCRKMRI